MARPFATRRSRWHNRRMPNRDNPSLKDPELYEKLVDEGNSEQKAARISNAAAARGRAKEIGLTGYSRLTKAKLIEALRDS